MKSEPLATHIKRPLAVLCALASMASAVAQTTTWHFTGTVESNENLYHSQIQDARYLRGVYQPGNRVSGSVTFKRTSQDYQEPTNADPDAPDDPDRGFYYQTVDSLEFHIDAAGWPGDALVFSSAPPPPLSANPWPGSLRVVNDEDIAGGLVLRDSLLLHAPQYSDGATFDPVTFQMIPVKLVGWDAIPGTRASVLAFLFIQEMRTDGVSPTMLAGDGLDFALPDLAQPNVSAVLEVRMIQVPNTGESFRIVARLDSLTETPPPAPWVRIGRMESAAGELEVRYQGFLTTSEDLEIWTPLIPQPPSPFTVPPNESGRFYRALR